MERAIAKHKIVAIIPFEISIDAKKLPKGATLETIRDQERDLGYIMQSQMQTRFLKRAGEYSIEFQDVDKTNALLAKDSITYENIREKTKDEIATVLGVDGIVGGTIRMAQPMSLGAAVALQVLVGVSGATNKIDVTITVHEGSDAKLLWKYSHQYAGSVGSSPESLAKEMMKQIAKKFPYRQ
jgi:hypothetical protein